MSDDLLDTKEEKNYKWIRDTCRCLFFEKEGFLAGISNL